jgi:hypothetical protein|tara:strand:- start:10 stop:186 length:177 start_codon:yes stop_codon:yes gene_type:complete
VLSKQHIVMPDKYYAETARLGIDCIHYYRVTKIMSQGSWFMVLSLRVYAALANDLNAK